ncbi:4a-hydroxytetrahydrobiopterin dehydratase [Geomonas sp. Red32]|uniref:4a-hydroxytetrahydrobiopterin dehydratase n=1 Tax=Geomonas sp. Red32 TaxID=2912856 RepID=UPI00202CEF3D|nr:4a-hydroxytetrahydrobiopterin dehydratase [Geomonas sp. Red32]MCM0084145.1 4a-hydroxytetrahydrobiopterin dehydratase [Geomonas sp. Red32]
MTEEISNLSTRQCQPCEGGTPPLEGDRVAGLLGELPGWELRGAAISKEFDFKNYYQTISFVNAVAWIANSQGHHPDLEVSYRRCRVSYVTHAIGGLSENVFICAAKVEALFGW